MIIKNGKTISSVIKGGQVISKIMKGTLTVYEAFKKLVASGVPPLTLSNSVGKDLVDYKIYGYSKQQLNDTTNIWDGTYTTGSYYDANGNLVDLSTIAMSSMSELKYKKYNLYCITKTNAEYNFRFNYFDENQTWLSQIVVSVTTPNVPVLQEVEVPDGAKYINFSVYATEINAGQQIYPSVNNEPTIDIPIEIESVGEKSSNLFNNELPYKDLETLITSASDLKAGLRRGQMIFYGILPSSVGSEMVYNRNNSSCVLVPVENNKTYCLNGYSKQGISLLDENFISVQAGENKINVITNTTNAKYLCIYVHNKAQSSPHQTWTLEEVLNNLMINEGETSLSYEPYGYKVPVKASGKNLVEKLYNGYADTSVFPELAAGGSLVFQTIKLKNVKAGTYTFSFERPVNIARSMSTSSHNANLSIKPNPTSNTQITTIKLEQDEEDYQLSFRDSVSSSTQWNDGWVQCEIGDTATDYEPYHEPITTNIYLKEPLRSLIYKSSAIATDYIDFSNQKVVREVKKKTFDSSIDLNLYDDVQENVLGFYGNVFSDGSGYIRTTILSNRLVRSETDIAPRAVLSVNYETFYATASALKMTISKERVSDKEALKSWLDDNELYFVYPLLTPIEETIELPNIPTFKGGTILSIDTEIQPSNTEVIYKGK